MLSFSTVLLLSARKRVSFGGWAFFEGATSTTCPGICGGGTAGAWAWAAGGAGARAGAAGFRGTWTGAGGLPSVTWRLAAHASWESGARATERGPWAGKAFSFVQSISTSQRTRALIDSESATPASSRHPVQERWRRRRRLGPR